MATRGVADGPAGSRSSSRRRAASPQGGAAPAAGARRRGRGPRTSGWWALFFLAPTGIGLGVFYIWPVIQTLYYSFTSWGPFGGHSFTGLANYRALLHDPALSSAFLNTLWYCLLGLLGIPISLVLAQVLGRRGRKGVSVYRTLMFLPVVTMPAAIAIVWRWLYNGDYGLIDELLSKVGIKGPYWISDPHTALIAVAIVGIWSTIGYNMVVLMAGIQGIPRTYYEAAELDGAGPVRQFLSVTLPLLTPSIFFVMVYSVIGSLQTFDLIYVLIGPQNAALPQAQSVIYLFYQDSFIDNNRGYGAAMAFVLMLVIIAVTGLQFRLQKRWVHYG
jgi:multiple sugar transport system permease protein